MRGTLPVLGEQAPELTLAATTGGAVSLASLWASGPLVLVFLRHAGCPFSRDMIGQLRRRAFEFAAREATVALVLPVDVAHARAACDPPSGFVCLADPRGEGYRAYGLARGSLWQVAGPAVLLATARAVLAGHLPGIPRGDLYLLGGAFVVGPCGRLRYVHRARTAADNTTPARLLAALDGIAAVSERRGG